MQLESSLQSSVRVSEQVKPKENKPLLLCFKHTDHKICLSPHNNPFVIIKENNQHVCLNNWECGSRAEQGKEKNRKYKRCEVMLPELRGCISLLFKLVQLLFCL